MARQCRLGWAAGVSTLVASMFQPALSIQSKGPAESDAKKVTTFFKSSCLPCHSAANKRGGVALPLDPSGPLDQEILKRAQRRIDEKSMPPEGSPQPSASQRVAISQAITNTINQACNPAEMSRVTLRRLNRAEYNNTIRDLFGIAYSPADFFPSDEVGNGFDNIGQVLSISPLLMEKYLDAAEKVAAKVVPVPFEQYKSFPGSELKFNGGGGPNGNSAHLYTNGAAGIEVTVPKAGTYLIQARVWAQQAGSELAKVNLFAGNKRGEVTEISAERAAAAETINYTVQLKPGKMMVGCAFLNDYYKADDPNPNNRDRNLIIDSIVFAGPLNEAKPTFATRQFLLPGTGIAEPKDRVRAVLTNLAYRAYRRPPTQQEIDSLFGLVASAIKNGETLEKGYQLAITAVLCSPHFIFRPEPAAGEKLTDFELASRLSYFIWSSMPDEELLEVAKKGNLKRPETMKAQVLRMIADPRSEALGSNFASQWLGLRKLEISVPDPKLFPNVDYDLKKDMERETLTFFNRAVQENKPITDFLDADYTYVNRRLANFYGIEGVTSDQFTKVKWPNSTRAGILTQASVLLVTSNPNRTSPVKRGKWVLENILGTPPPPPPPNVGVLPEDQGAPIPRTLKERIAAHVKNPSCAGCHKRLDPIGIALENFDAVGKWRTQDGPYPVDSKSEMPDGTPLKGPEDLTRYLTNNQDAFARAFCEKLMTYALGRALTPSDDCSIDELAKSTKAGGYRTQSLILAVATSRAFTSRGKEK